MSALEAGGVRASDAERERAAQVLQKAAADGRLSPEEAGERLAQASAARYRNELVQLVADLPDGIEARAPARRRPSGAWWIAAGVARAVAVVALISAAWFFWGLRYFWLLPLAFLALSRMRWRRRMWRHRVAMRGW